MNPDEYQKAWRAESSQTRVTVNADVLLREVRRNQREFQSNVWWGDYGVIGIILLLLPVWTFLGITAELPWSWYLMIPALVWIVAFILGGRARHRPRRSPAGEPLLVCVVESLAQVEHQIWSLRNVFWWYLLPMGLPLLAFVGHVFWLRVRDWSDATGALFVVVLFGTIASVIMLMNRHVIRTQHEPRRRELLALLSSLDDDAAGEVNGEYPILLGETPTPCSPRRRAFGLGCAALLLLVGIGTSIKLVRSETGYPRLAPYTDVLWGQDRPLVELDGDWHVLYSIDGIDVKEIVAFCRSTYGDKWQKRFAEDLVQVLADMGHSPGGTVALDTLSTGPEAVRRVREVAMTAKNRWTVRAAAEARAYEDAELKEQRSASTPAPDLAAPFQEHLERIRATHRLPAMAALAMRGGDIVERATVGAISTKDSTTVGADAQWHLGSNTKAMTATLAGVLVDEGLLRWDSTIGEVLGSPGSSIHEWHGKTTLTMLLQHRSGIQANINWFAAPEDRIVCALEILSKAPAQKVGAFSYSNAGYVVAGAMMEKVTGKRWEDLMREKLFTPLGMANTGFGAPTRAGAPWGHQTGLLGWSPKNPTVSNADNAPVLGPAGTVHATVEDYGRFIAAHLKGARGEGGIVSAETFKVLHTPFEGGEYGMGWSVVEREWAGGRALTHQGSNTLWYATVWVAPEKNMAYFAATNAGHQEAFEAVDEAVSVLIARQTP